jgi:hypothetical protein
VKVRRFDPKTGELLMPWTSYPSQAAAVRACGVAGVTIRDLLRGRKTHHAGMEVRRCDPVDAEDADEASVLAPSPPYFPGMVTKPVVSEGRKSGGGGCGRGDAPKWLGISSSERQHAGGVESQAVEVNPQR